MTTNSRGWTRWPFRTWRRAAEVAQAALVLGLPFLRIGGESALRFDVPTLRLHFFGASLAMDEMFPVLAAALAVTFAFLLGTLVLGRAWCGWACPQTVLSDLTARLDRWRRRGGARAALAWLLLALASALAAAGLLWYFVGPRAFALGLWRGTLHPAALWSWAATGAVLFLDLAFLRARFCATACPYARLQGVLFDRHTLVVAYDAARAADCIDCGACVRCCPTGIDIRDGLQMECIACAECIDAAFGQLKWLDSIHGAMIYEIHQQTVFGPLNTLIPFTVALFIGTLAAMGIVLSLGARRVFAPSAVTESFRTYPAWMSLRPLSLRAEAAEMVIGIAAAARLKNEYRDIAVPVVIMAGTDDHFIDSGWNSVRLHRELPGSELTLAPGAGHMVHHIVPEEVMAAIDAAAAAPVTLSDSTPVRAVAARMAQEAAGA